MPDSEMLAAVKVGTLDLAAWFSCCNPALTKLGYIESMLPFATFTGLEWEGVYEWWGYEDLLRQDYAEYGVKYVTHVICDAVTSLISTKPVRTLDDLKGMKIATYELWGDCYTNFGAVINDIPADEFYMGGKTGVIDGVAWGSSVCYEYYKLHEVFPYLLDDNPGPLAGSFIMNQELWDSLPEDLQMAVFNMCRNMENIVRTRRYGLENHPDWGRPLYKEVTRLSPEEHVKFVEAGKSRWDEFAAENEMAAKAVEIFRTYNSWMEKTKWMRPLPGAAG